MTRRDALVVFIGLVVAVLGSLFVLLDYPDLAFIALLTLGFGILFVVVLQRRQLGILQKRALEILRINSRVGNSPPQAEQHKPDEAQAIQISTKKIIGLLQAQQLRIDDVSNQLLELHRQLGSSHTLTPDLNMAHQTAEDSEGNDKG